MQINGKNLVAAIDCLKENITQVRFMKEDNKSWYIDKAPSVVNWGGGDIVVLLNGTQDSSTDYRFNTELVIAVLKRFGVQANVVSADGLNNNAVKFTAKADADIIYILDMVVKQQVQQKKLSLAEWKLAGLNQNIDQLIQQLPYVKSSLFSRGVKAMKNQVEVLQNIRADHKKQR